MTSIRNETETVSGMEKAGPFSCCGSHQSVVSPSPLLLLALTVDIWNTFCGVFMVQHVKLMLRILEFGVFTF